MIFILQAMVARGDLGAELPIEEVPLLQVVFSLIEEQKLENLYLLLAWYQISF